MGNTYILGTFHPNGFLNIPTSIRFIIGRNNMWQEFVIHPFEGKSTLKFKGKTLAIETAQQLAIDNPFDTITVWRATHHTDTGMVTLECIVDYWFDEDMDKLHIQKGDE